MFSAFRNALKPTRITSDFSRVVGYKINIYIGKKQYGNIYFYMLIKLWKPKSKHVILPIITKMINEIVKYKIDKTCAESVW